MPVQSDNLVLLPRRKFFVYVLCFVIVVDLLEFVNGRKSKQLYEHHDALLAARCEAKCSNGKSNKHQCIKQCLTSEFTKFGECPQMEYLTPFDTACLEACRNDSQCPGTLKCCKHTCGVTCKPARGLDNVIGLPPIPSDISVSERRRGRTLLIHWNSQISSTTPSTSRIIYILEERHHAGRFFTESRLGAWTARHKTIKTNASIRHLVKPGRWYQFRVAAVNENGTRGWSEHSMKFITSLGPRKPCAPSNMTVGPLHAAPNGTLWGELRWNAPSSDLPIQRYKVFWSRRLHGATALDSVLVQHQTIPKDQTKFELKNLQINSLYFLQVQALSQFGREKLKGEKAGLVLNTTNYTNVTEILNSSSLTINKENEKSKNITNFKVEGLHIQKIYWNRDKLVAKIAWKGKKYSTKYTVSWWSRPCQYSSSLPSELQMAVTTKSTHYEIYNLEFKCRYRVSVREVTSEGFKSFQEASLVFVTPSCNELAATIHKNKPYCLLYN